MKSVARTRCDKVGYGPPCSTLSTHDRADPLIAVLATIAVLLCMAASSVATPRNYASFGRKQVRNYTPDPHSLLRIWIVYIGQGDGILIQLPSRLNYDALPDDGDQSRTERIDVLIDGGSSYGSNRPLMGRFIQRLYSGGRPIIEHAIITHHDADHITGLTRLINDNVARVETFYHNGLVSWLPGGHFPSSISTSQKAVYDGTKANPTRGMAFETTRGSLSETDLINSRTQLIAALEGGDLHGVYEDLAEAVDWLATNDNSVEFRRCFVGADFINEVEEDRRTAIPEVRFELLWPEKPAMPYKSRNWGNTINGNSITFRLVYGEFEMLFTGDQNEHSEEEFLSGLIAAGRTDALDCDVLKIPHHGSIYFDSAFIDTVFEGLVLSVASMGSQGFRNSWKHPNPGLINLLGRAHRFYSTYIHERKFDTTTFENAEALAEMVETDRRTILIETDGDWFRLVEIPIKHQDLNRPPTVKSTHSGNGTRWINARNGD